MEEQENPVGKHCTNRQRRKWRGWQGSVCLSAPSLPLPLPLPPALLCLTRISGSIFIALKVFILLLFFFNLLV